MGATAGFLMSVLAIVRGHQGSRQAPLASGADTLILSRAMMAQFSVSSVTPIVAILFPIFLFFVT